LKATVESDANCARSSGNLYDQAGILHTGLDLAELACGKLDLNVVGHYGRPDLFRLGGDERPKPPLMTIPAEK
jgi:nitrilase